MNTRHTPGPWKAEHLTIAEWTWPNRIGRRIAEIEPSQYTHEIEEQKANARLIAAAPDLLAALQWFVDDLPGIIRQSCPQGVPMEVSRAHDVARAAIAAATGGNA